MPESAAYDSSTNRYFVSNYETGNIIQIDSAGEKTYFQKGLSKSLGMVISDSTLYVVTNLKMIKGFNLKDGRTVFKVQINESKFLNDITCDNSENLYVTDSNDKTIYKINITTQTYSVFVKTELDNPNGIIYDRRNNRLVLCYFRKNAQIDEVSLKDSKLTTIAQTKFDNLDGISMDELGNFYISSWGLGSFKTGFSREGIIYKYDNLFKEDPIIVVSNLHGPADIYYNIKRNELAIPLFLENDVMFQSVPAKK